MTKCFHEFWEVGKFTQRFLDAGENQEAIEFYGLMALNAYLHEGIPGAQNWLETRLGMCALENMAKDTEH